MPTIFLILSPFLDSFLAANTLMFPFNLLKITPIIIAIAAAYSIKRFFVPIAIAGLLFIILSYPFDIQAAFSVFLIPFLFNFKKAFSIFSEQWIRISIFFAGFSLNYIIWVVNNIRNGIVDYPYFLAAIFVSVLFNTLISFTILRTIEYFKLPLRYEIPKNRI